MNKFLAIMLTMLLAVGTTALFLTHYALGLLMILFIVLIFTYRVPKKTDEQLIEEYKTRYENT